MKRDQHITAGNFKAALILRYSSLLANAMASSTPIWRPIPSRQMARILGITIQTLANWRFREQGPRFSHAAKGKGNKVLYRMSDVLEWLSAKPSWEFEGEWLAHKGLGPEELDRDYIEWVKTLMD